MTVFNKAAVSQELKRDGSLAMNAVKRFSADQCPAQAASIAFYSAFSLAPTLLMVIAVAGWFFGAEAARGQIFARVHDFLGNDAAAAIQAIVENAHKQGGGGIAAITSFCLLIIGASATFSSLNTALNVVFPALPREKRSGIALMVRVRLISFGLVLGVAFLLVVTLVLDTAVAFVGKMIWGDSPFVMVGDIVQMLLSLIVLAFAFTALMKLLPDASVKWRDAMVGGLVAALLFTIGKKLFALYLAHAGTASAFGAAGSLAVLLMWLYFSSAVFLLGGEFAAVKGGFGDRKDLRETAAQKAAEEAERVLDQGRPSTSHASASASTSAVPKSIAASSVLTAHAARDVLRSPSSLLRSLPRWAADLIAGGQAARPTARIRKGQVSASPIDHWINQSKYPVALRIAKFAGPILLQGISVMIPFGRRRLAKSAARAIARKTAAQKATGKNGIFGRKPRSAVPAASVVPVNRHVAAMPAKSNAHPVTAALFAAVTGLVVAAIANRKHSD